MVREEYKLRIRDFFPFEGAIYYYDRISKAEEDITQRGDVLNTQDFIDRNTRSLVVGVYQGMSMGIIIFGGILYKIFE